MTAPLRMFLGAALSGALFCHAQLQVTTENIAPGPKTEAQLKYAAASNLWVSPDGRHIASVIFNGSRLTVAVDNVPSPELFDEIGMFTREPGAETQDAPLPRVIFSPVGGRAGFVGRRGGTEVQKGIRRVVVGSELFLVVDGKATRIHTEQLQNAGVLTFSSDGKRYAAVVKGQQTINGSAEFAAWVILDGVSSPAYGSIAESLFSPGGSRHGYIAEDRQGAVVVLDGKPGPRYQKAHSLRFSADGKRYLYAAKSADGWRVYVDGKPDAAVFKDSIKFVQLSSNGAGYAYAGVLEEGYGRAAPVLNGKAGKTYESIDQLMLSPDGKRHAARVVLQQAGTSVSGMRVVVDGVESQTFTMMPDEVTFSRDSQHVVFPATITASGFQKRFLVVDGKEIPADAHQGKQVVYNPSGPGFAYRTNSDDNYARVNLNGNEGPPLQSANLDSLAFSPDGAHIVYPGRVAQKPVLVHDGEVFPFPMELQMFGSHTGQFATIHYGASPKHFAFTAFSAASGQQNVWVGKMRGPDCHGASMPTFSPDGNHFAFSCLDDKASGSVKVFLDGKPGPVVTRVFENTPSTFHFLEDGRLEVIAIAEGNVQRIRITAPAEGLAGFGPVTPYDAAQKPAASTTSATPLPASSSPAATPAGIPATPAGAVDQLKDKMRKKIPRIFK